jgi:hypothetical protein
VPDESGNDGKHHRQIIDFIMNLLASRITPRDGCAPESRPCKVSVKPELHAQDYRKLPP